MICNLSIFNWTNKRARLLSIYLSFSMLSDGCLSCWVSSELENERALALAFERGTWKLLKCSESQKGGKKCHKNPYWMSHWIICDADDNITFCCVIICASFVCCFFPLSLLLRCCCVFLSLLSVCFFFLNLRRFSNFLSLSLEIFCFQVSFVCGSSTTHCICFLSYCNLAFALFFFLSLSSQSIY